MTENRHNRWKAIEAYANLIGAIATLIAALQGLW
jgi:hypothetical protein